MILHLKIMNQQFQSSNHVIKREIKEGLEEEIELSKLKELQLND